LSEQTLFIPRIALNMETRTGILTVPVREVLSLGSPFYAVVYKCVLVFEFAVFHLDNKFACQQWSGASLVKHTA
jgi:hypothetical protein